MEASEFVKKFGWGKTIELIEFYNRCGSLTCDCDFTYDDLKRLAESHELVESYGGLFEAKIYADSEYRSLSAPQITKRLKQAIADVEGCQ